MKPKRSPSPPPKNSPSPKKASLRKKAPSLKRSAVELMEGAFERNLTSEGRKPNFYERVYAMVELIPRGKVTSYGAIAETLGMKGSSRTVGQALGSLPDGSEVPAQRVINRFGALSGAHKFGGYSRMRGMLEKEGVTFVGELVDMKRHFWHPKELENE